jgi:succinate-semialdehyde dehydrogenase/glutarate-semialdehyde dehydrogenase
MTGRMLEIRAPGSGEIITAVPVEGEDAVRLAVTEARSAQRRWAQTSLGERRRRMAALARVLHRRAPDIVGRVCLETGKPEAEALAAVIVSVDLIQYYRRVGPGVLKPRRVRAGWLLGKAGYVEREPYGVIGAIMPWNYPFIMVMDLLVPSLFAGNAVVVKPSEHTPWTAQLLPELVREAGFPDGLVQIVTGDGSTGAALIKAGVNRVVFTGSTRTGRKVGAAAGEALVPVTLELGGKDVAIVLEDADLDRAAVGVAYAAYFNAGQTCLSVERALVVRSVYDAFVEKVCAYTETLRVGAGPDRDVGPMVTPEQLAIVEGQVRDAVAKGATVLTGGRKATEEGQVYLPTVLVDVDPSMAIMRDETFGPVLPIVPVADEEEALAEANRLGYGLFGSVWTGDRERGLAVARRIRSGGVSVNDALSHYAVPGLPVGGVDESGFGSRRGVEGLEEMSRVRTVLVHRWGPRRELWWFPYTAGKLRVFRALLDWRSRGGAAGLLAAVRRLLGRGGDTWA